MDITPTQTPLPMVDGYCHCRPVKWFYGENLWPAHGHRSTLDWTYTGACRIHGQPGVAIPAELLPPTTPQATQEVQS
jgi:hypothetical protein